MNLTVSREPAPQANLARPKTFQRLENYFDINHFDKKE